VALRFCPNVVSAAPARLRSLYLVRGNPPPPYPPPLLAVPWREVMGVRPSLLSALGGPTAFGVSLLLPTGRILLERGARATFQDYHRG
jgi:hypothetical protein